MFRKIEIMDKKYAPKLILTKQPFTFFDKFKDKYSKSVLEHRKHI